MRSEINTEKREDKINQECVTEIMKSTAEIAEHHKMKKMKWLIGGICFVVAVLGVMVGTVNKKCFLRLYFMLAS